MGRIRHTVFERSRRDEGVTMVVFALFLTALLLVAGLAIDGGRAYANRRQMQNSADIAAMAGTTYLAEQKFSASPPATVSGLVDTVKAQSGVNESDQTPDQLDCWVVSSGVTPQRLPLSGPIDICDAPTTAWSLVVTGSAAGVEVRTAREQDTFLVQLADIDSFNARAAATATMQPLVATGGAPFIVCGASEPVGYGILDGGSILPSAVGQWYPLQAGNTGGRDPALRNCSAGNAFDGTGPTPGDEFQVPQIGFPLSGGNGNGFSDAVLTGLVGENNCTEDSDRSANGCRVILPIASSGYGNGSKRVTLNVAAFGVFEVWGNGTGNTPDQCTIFGRPNPKYCGRLLGAAQATGGTGGTGDVVDGNPYLIRLVPNPAT